ncbi:hypothetical protein HPC49_42500, partial [Pyxidicoccus fallax]
MGGVRNGKNAGTPEPATARQEAPRAGAPDVGPAEDAQDAVDRHLRTAGVLLRQGSAPRAFGELARASRTGLMTPRLAAALVRYALLAGTEAAAITLLDAASGLTPGVRLAVRRQLARVLRRVGQVPRAIASLEALLTELPEDRRARRVLQVLRTRLHARAPGESRGDVESPKRGAGEPASSGLLSKLPTPKGGVQGRAVWEDADYREPTLVDSASGKPAEPPPPEHRERTAVAFPSASTSEPRERTAVAFPSVSPPMPHLAGASAAGLKPDMSPAELRAKTEMALPAVDLSRGASPEKPRATTEASRPASPTRTEAEPSAEKQEMARPDSRSRPAAEPPAVKPESARPDARAYTEVELPAVSREEPRTKTEMEVPAVGAVPSAQTESPRTKTEVELPAFGTSAGAPPTVGVASATPSSDARKTAVEMPAVGVTPSQSPSARKSTAKMKQAHLSVPWDEVDDDDADEPQEAVAARPPAARESRAPPPRTGEWDADEDTSEVTSEALPLLPGYEPPGAPGPSKAPGEGALRSSPPSPGRAARTDPPSPAAGAVSGKGQPAAAASPWDTQEVSMADLEAALGGARSPGGAASNAGAESTRASGAAAPNAGAESARSSGTSAPGTGANAGAESVRASVTAASQAGARAGRSSAIAASSSGAESARSSGTIAPDGGTGSLRSEAPLVSGQRTPPTGADRTDTTEAGQGRVSAPRSAARAASTADAEELARSQKLEAQLVARQAWRELAQLYLKRADRAKDVTVRAEALTRLAEVMENELQDPAGAARMYREIVELTGDRTALREQVRLLSSRGDASLVRRALDEAIQRARSERARAGALLTRGERWLHMGEPAKARADFEAADALAPGMLPVLAGLLRCVSASERPAAAERLRLALATAPRRAPDRLEALRMLADAAEESLGDPRMAQWAWTEVLAESPESEQARERLMALARKLGDPKALGHLLRAQLARESRGPSARHARLELVSTLEALGDTEAALHELRQAVRYEPGHKEAWLLLVDRLLARGSTGEAAWALEHAATATEDELERERTWERLARLWKDVLRDAERAQVYARRAEGLRQAREERELPPPEPPRSATPRREPSGPRSPLIPAPPTLSLTPSGIAALENEVTSSTDPGAPPVAVDEPGPGNKDARARKGDASPAARDRAAAPGESTAAVQPSEARAERTSAAPAGKAGQRTSVPEKARAERDVAAPRVPASGGTNVPSTPAASAGAVPPRPERVPAPGGMSVPSTPPASGALPPRTERGPAPG